MMLDWLMAVIYTCVCVPLICVCVLMLYCGTSHCGTSHCGHLSNMDTCFCPNCGNPELRTPLQSRQLHIHGYNAMVPTV